MLYLIFTDNIWRNFILVAFIDTTDDEEGTFDSIEVGQFRFVIEPCDIYGIDLRFNASVFKLT